jgi:type VI secretion system secreted protein VgrG
MAEEKTEITLQSKDFDSDVLRVYKLHGRERISKMFELELEVVQLENGELTLDDVAGANVSVHIRRGEKSLRHFHGVVAYATDFADLETKANGFRLTVVPRLWFATLVETLEVYVDRSVPDIIKGKLEMLDMAEPANFRWDLDATYAERKMVVQYQESDLNFVQRWCEHLGIFYFFTFDEEHHKLVLGDHAGAYSALNGEYEVRYQGRGEKTGIYQLEVDRQLVPSVFVCRDYNDQIPAMELSEQHQLEQGFGGGFIEYGLDYRDGKEGKQFAKVRAEQRLATRQRYRGTSDDPRFTPGHTFALADHPSYSGSMVLLEVEHRAVQQLDGFSEMQEPGRYENHFVAIDADICFRPARATPVPQISGIVSGIVETGQGDIGRHAKLDNQGRYTVRLLFDTTGPGGKKASCPIRMLQPLSGANYGVHFPLKPGIEVAVAFRGGNPDRPVIVGAAPNPITRSPVVDAEATKSRIKTRSGIIIEFEDADRG